MLCTLCDRSFETNPQVYNRIGLPETGSSGLWKKGVRGKIIMEVHDVCSGCLDAIQKTIVFCKEDRKQTEGVLARVAMMHGSSGKADPGAKAPAIIKLKHGEQHIDADLLDAAMEDAQEKIVTEMEKEK